MRELIEILERDERITYLKNKKAELLNDNDFMSKVNKLRNLDKYSNEYIELKVELFKNPTFIEFKRLENEINILIMEINQRLKTLTDERGCM